MKSPWRRHGGWLVAAFLCGFSSMNAQSTKFPDISQLSAQTAWPDPLVMLDGSKVVSAGQWNEQRRPELKAMFAHYMYGTIPPKPEHLAFAVDVADKNF